MSEQITLGKFFRKSSDEEILELFNDCYSELELDVANFEHYVIVGIVEDKSIIEVFETGYIELYDYNTGFSMDVFLEKMKEKNIVFTKREEGRF